MIRIGKYRMGFAAASMAVVFGALSVCAVVAACRQARPEWPVPLWQLIVINECLALLFTLVYGILAHFAIALIDRLRR